MFIDIFSTIWSPTVSIRWYSQTVNVERYGHGWTDQKCRMWSEEQSEDMAWTADVPQCPCLLKQALVDFRFRSDEACNMFGDGECALHKGAVHCVLSEFPR